MRESVSYYLGCPVWNCRDWIGPVFEKEQAESGTLRAYTRFFNTVEANSTFYALPPMATVERWMAEAGDGFKFCPKFPKTISHDRRLSNAAEETRGFLKVLESLAHGSRLGPSFLQLPPSFNANSFDRLEGYLKRLPTDFRYAVEPRHVTWYDKSDNEARLDGLLADLGMDKVVFDSRPLFATESPDETERRAQSRKPNPPVRKIAISDRPFLRLVGQNDVLANGDWIKEWAPTINKWILENKRPFVFTHCPNEAFAPFFARQLHEQLRKLNPLLEELPEFAGDRQHGAEEPQQLDLF